MLRRRFRAFEDYCLNVSERDQALPEAFRLLRTCVDSDHAALFRCDTSGRMCGAFHEVPAHAPQAHEFIERARRGTDRTATSDPPSVAELFAARTPAQLLRFDDATSRASELYRNVIGPIGGREVLRVGLRAGTTPVGVLALVRAADQAGFDSRDQADLLALGRSFRRLLHDEPRADADEQVGEGFLVISPDGNLLRADPAGRRLWNTMHDARFLPLFDGATTMRALTGPGAKAQLHCELGTGRFVLERIQLQDTDDGDPAHRTTLIRVRHTIAPRIHQLREMDRLGLSSMQKMVCLDLLRGLSHAEIAAEQGIGLRTAISHANDVYRKVGVHDRAELMAAFRRV